MGRLSTARSAAARLIAGGVTLLALLVPASAVVPTEVVLVKRAGVMAYEEVAEAFREGCRVPARVLSVTDERFAVLRFGPTELVITVGQEAFDAVRTAPGHHIAALAFHAPDTTLGPRATPTPELILRLLVTARHGLRRVGAVYGPRSRDEWKAARAAAQRLGIELHGREVDDGPSAVRALRELVDEVQALWLPADTDVITPQVFQFALRLQIEHGIPVAAATRQQVHSGALLAVDFNPRDAGHSAADLANRILEGRAPTNGPGDRLDLLSGARMTVNPYIARRLGADLAALQRLGARVE